ncbi:MAG: outer membrane protein assembly factor BamA [Longimicrobiales bacterium]
MTELTRARFRSFLATTVAAVAVLVLPGISLPSASLSAQQQGVPLVRVDSITVEGNVRLSEVAIIGTLGFTAGSQVTYREIQRGIKNLFATGQFADVAIFAEGEANEPVLLRLEVEERDLVQRINITGLIHAKEETVRDTAGLQTGQPYSPPRILAAKEFIRSELAKEGIPFARIEERTEDIPDRPGEIRLFLDVTEGNRITVAQLAVFGNEEISEEDIRGAMSTKPEGFWWFRSGTYDAEQFRSDLAVNIPALYRTKGYLDIQVLSDTLIVDPETGKTRVEVQVEEGPRYRLANFSVEGNRRFSTEELEAYFQTGGGGLLAPLGFGGGGEDDEYFNATAFEEGRVQVQQAYSNEGYLYARVDPFVEHVETEEGEPPAVRAGWRIVEGNPAYVNRVNIEGNDFTHERVIREKIFILPGDVYSMQRLISSWQSIGSLGFFETPLPEPSIVPDERTGDVDITFKVTERQTGSVNFGTAVGGGTGVSGFLGYDQPNLFGQAKQGHLRWDFGRYINSFTLTYTDPSLLQSLVSGTVSVFSTRDRFYQFSTGRRKRTGFSLRFGFPIPWSLRTRVFAGYSLAKTDYRLYQDVDDTSLFGLPPGTQSTFSVGISRNTMNHPLFPTAGSRQSINADINGGIFGGDGDFTKYTAETAWYVPAGQFGGGAPGSRPIQMTLGLSVRGGAIFGNVDRFPFDRFWMGGVQFGEQLRGYDETSITPYGFYPERSRDLTDIQRLGNGFLSITSEYAIRFNDNLSISTFLDAGNIWSNPRDMDPTRLFRGAGFGVQLVTPFGPIGLDYAYGFDKTSPGWQLHFRMGQGY